MKIILRRCCYLVLLLAPVLLASCAVSAPRAEAPVSKLSPENVFFDVEQEGLKVLWRQELGQRTDSDLRNIYCSGRMVVVEAEGGEIHCLDSSNGTWKATKVLNDNLMRAPTAMGHVLFLIVRNSLHRFDTVAGSLSKAFDPGFAVFTAPQVYRDSLILAGGNGHLRRLPLGGTGNAWTVSIEGPIFEQPVIADGRLFAAGSHDKVIALQVDDGLVLWRWTPRLPSRLTSGVAVLGDRLFVGDNRGFIYSLRAEHGLVTWKTMVEGPIVGKPEIVGTQLLVFTGKPSLISLDAGGDLRMLWSHDGATELLTTSETVAYVLNEDHSVAALCLETGAEMWRHPLPPDCKITGDAARPALYIAGSNGAIVAFGELD